MVQQPQENGVFIYEDGVWIKVNDKFWYPKDDGLYVVFFMNVRCPACNRYWRLAISKLLEEKYVEISKTKKCKIVYVKCEWFAKECFDETAKNTFLLYLVSASPTTLLIKVENSEVTYAERYEGRLPYEKLIELIYSFEDRYRKVIMEERLEIDKKPK